MRCYQFFLKLIFIIVKLFEKLDILVVNRKSHIVVLKPFHLLLFKIATLWLNEWMCAFLLSVKLQLYCTMQLVLDYTWALVLGQPRIYSKLYFWLWYYTCVNTTEKKWSELWWHMSTISPVIAPPICVLDCSILQLKELRYF